MASNSGTRKKGASGNRSSAGRKTAASSRQSSRRVTSEEEKKIGKELLLLLLFTAVVLLFFCNFGIIGPVGDALSGVLFGVFGIMAYVAPICIFLLVAFGISNKGNTLAMLKLAAAITLLLVIMSLLHLLQGNMASLEGYSPLAFYQLGREERRGGGILGGTLAYLFYSLLDMLGAVFLLLVLSLGCLVILTGKSLVSGMKKKGRHMVNSAREDVNLRRERVRKRREELAEERYRLQEEEKENSRQEALRQNREEAEKILRMDKKVSGVMLDTRLKKEAPVKEEFRHEDIHEITLQNTGTQITRRETANAVNTEEKKQESDFDFSKVRIHTAQPVELEEITLPPMEAEPEGREDDWKEPPEIWPKPALKTPDPLPKQERAEERKAAAQPGGDGIEPTVQPKEKAAANRPYHFPPLSCLAKMNTSQNQGGTEQLKETAMRLQQTLATFGVKVTITDISQGPSVTRYELQPEQGVKVSKIVGLADDIKLNLAATDIRIEAPIPGKAAVGIEVPNKENSAVGLRELLESKEYQEFPSRLAFAVGKDIAGKVVVTDIAKMPHMLIAGATGSGKSVCINTLIMSILYKARPEEVKLIMIDPKVVELSVYNGIPHLLIPVVTDPKKAAGALHWGVAEMTDRYQKFADFNVRDLKGYNGEIDKRLERGEQDVPPRMPQIVIIVDELADLMMVAPGEVEESICRLAQLARAAGIHLIIATQRPSVDVITGLIKANMPSRVAFAVSSGVDSRTILDMNGAEKLLGKGDMLFYPQGYPKPARMQGAFVSDREVGDVVDFLKNQTLGNVYSEDIEEKIKNIGGTAATGTGGGPDSQRDSYFEEAGKFIIEKDKASIGMLQRVFKIGFNRAARIMDQLADAGVVGEEEGTKPRKVLMSLEQFESYIEEVL